MKNLKTNIGLDEASEPLKGSEKLIFIGIISFPLWGLLALNLLNSYYEAHPEPVIKKYTSYGLQGPDLSKPIELKAPKLGPGDKLIPNQTAGGVVLHLNGVDIYTGKSSEEILNELSLDYQDLFDYYGGAEELY